ncbi:MAG TPA: phosphate ABC transporter permease PstA [Methanofastidiosum sp.]|jgi:phosphate ABC transporter permease subunit PstA/phosphate ABC transporter permease protein PstC|nr:phosphate ABC transporter permease PstA [Methanofastidiosum sp.]HNZ87031.1 phosphate ABC transporter permease PstA [Methanofastidiosum sp.]HOG73325.1 phosphate ABC transporter permease PstA [Methanofastidiosum sp.]HRZ19816.1 phosphate ABC transporter permease PstA [Methanofastidiosum sp.]
MLGKVNRTYFNGANPFHKKVDLKENIIVWLLLIAASLAILVSLAILYTLISGSIGFFFDPKVNILDFFIGTKWTPSGTNPSFGLLPLLSGTVLIAGGSILIATPLGLGAALYLTQFANKKASSIAKPIIELLAGIPSIVFGFFALIVISPILRQYFGASYFNAASAIIVMSVMILPIIVSVSDDSMRAVPRELKEASLAIGATKWETAIKVVMPAASSGIIASVLLGLARALGETMVVALAAGSVAKFTLNPLSEVQTMTAYIAQVATGDIPPGVAVSAAFAVGLVLFTITYIINLIAGRIVLKIQNAGGQASKNSKKIILKKPVVNKINTSTNSFLENKIEIKNINPEDTIKTRHKISSLGILLVGSCLVITTIFLGFLMFSILEQGLPGINLNFLTSYPSSIPSRAGIFPVIIGSIYLVGLAMIFAIPTSMGAAVYLTEFAKDNYYTRILRRLIQNLSGVPSIVFGLVGLTVFARIFGFGTSILSGSLTLAIMIMPIIIVTTEEALKAIPKSFREAARGLGATKWQTVRHHVIPYALPGTLTGSILALSRAIGETAPILFIASVFAKTAPDSIFDGFLALPVTIFFWTRHPKVEFQNLAASTILVLLIILFAMNIIAIIIRQRAQANRDW